MFQKTFIRKMIIREIMDTLNNKMEALDTLNLDLAQKRLKIKIEDFVLILDDVCEEDQSK